MPVWLHECVIAPGVFALAYAHAHRALGPARAAGELLALAAYGFTLEWVAIAVFGSHDYGDAWRWAPGGVPLAVAAVWAAVLSSAMALAARRLRTPWSRAGGAALLGITLDMLIEPVAVRLGLWRWTPPGSWLGVPVGNFVGWAVIVGAYSLGSEFLAAGGRIHVQAVRRIALAAASIVALLGVGHLWRAASLETTITASGGWVAWALVNVAALVVGVRTPAPASGEGLPARLASTGGGLPARVFLILATTFAVDAVVSADPPLRVVAAGSVLALAWTVRPARQAALARLGAVEGFVAILMKRRNRQPWTAEDYRLLREGLRRLARWTPAFFVFLLPGGMVLLAAYAWLLDRRRRRRNAATGTAS